MMESENISAENIAESSAGSEFCDAGNCENSAGSRDAERLEMLEKENARLKEEYDLLLRKNCLEKVCRQSGCSDPEYLEFCASRKGINIADHEALLQFVRELAINSPGCFTARIIPGSNAGNSSVRTSGAKPEVPDGDRIGLIALYIDDAPDA